MLFFKKRKDSEDEVIHSDREDDVNLWGDYDKSLLDDFVKFCHEHNIKKGDFDCVGMLCYYAMCGYLRKNGCEFILHRAPKEND